LKAALYYSNNNIKIIEMEKPEIGPEELLVEVKACGICGSDVMEWYRVKTAPRVLGHEMTGKVVEVGENVENYVEGDRIFVSHHVPCNTCKWCLKGHHTVCDTLRSTNYYPGGFAEYVKIPPINVDRGVFLLPPEVSYDQGIFIEPLACVVRGQRHVRVSPGDTVLVIGSGVSGILHIKYAKAVGAEEVIAVDISDFKLKMAGKMGADYAFKATDNVPEKIKEVIGCGADVVIVTAPVYSAMKTAFHSVDRGGSVLFFAPLEAGETLPVEVWELWRNEITITTSYGGSPQDIEIALKMIRSRRIEVEDLITHRLPLTEAKKGFELASRGNDSLKVVLYP
jgi:L-iditol 2-dehydrogenase